MRGRRIGLPDSDLPAQPVALLNLNDIGLKGMVITQPFLVPVVRRGESYLVTVQVNLSYTKAGETTTFLYSLEEEDNNIMGATERLLDRIRLEVENYDVIPDEWLTPQGLAIKGFLEANIRPDHGDHVNPSGLQRRLDQAEARALAEELAPQLEAQRVQVQSQVTPTASVSGDVPGKVTAL